MSNETSNGYVIWFTGLPGAGKTTLARALKESLHQRGISVEHLDGDVVRKDLCHDLGFTPEDRETNLRRVAFVARLLSKHGVVALCSFVSPYREVRGWLRESLGDFVEVFVNCSVEECTRRDPKGLYAKAIAGEIPRFTGISAPYEKPKHAEVRVDTESQSVEESLQILLDELAALGKLPFTGEADEFAPGERKKIEASLSERGYL